MIRGSLVAIVTPMLADGEVDKPALQRLLQFHLDQGSDGIVAVGTTGESATLSFNEHCSVIRLVVDYIDGRVPVLAGTGANSTTEAIELTRCARDAGADAALLVTPYYNKPTQEGLYLHHKAIAEAVDIPQVLYNVPGRTACDMSVETVERLAPIANIVGIKEATGELGRVQALRERCGQDFALYSGDDATACEFMLQGGDGVITVTGNVAPAAMHALCVAALEGKRAEAEQHDKKLRALHSALFVEANPIPVKWALHEMGMIGEAIRLPLTPLSERYRDEVRAALDAAGVETNGKPS